MGCVVGATDGVPVGLKDTVGAKLGEILDVTEGINDVVGV